MNSRLPDSGRDLYTLLFVFVSRGGAVSRTLRRTMGLSEMGWCLGTSRPAGRHCPSFELVGIARSPCLMAGASGPPSCWPRSLVRVGRNCAVGLLARPHLTIEGRKRPQPRGARPAEYRRPASRLGRFLHLSDGFPPRPAHIIGGAQSVPQRRICRSPVGATHSARPEALRRTTKRDCLASWKERRPRSTSECLT
jgi:hypothetical protein